MSLITTPTETVIFRNPETGRYGYKVRFVNTEHFHKIWDTCETLPDALSAWIRTKNASGTNQTEWMPAS